MCWVHDEKKGEIDRKEREGVEERVVGGQGEQRALAVSNTLT